MSRPCSTGSNWMPPLIVLATPAGSSASITRVRVSRGRGGRRGRGAEGHAGEVPALQHRPVLGAAADRIGHIPADLNLAGLNRLGSGSPGMCTTPPPTV